eukprot:TRINITY_DN147_c0_g3_i1.p2 TRINITY_DN147_c0_g3~~TRINITY_DN147_c0_g3_i1.p2  ORF type:complete len:468 (-),score=70.43 TRINITY_DN147_c0_g3_i1:8979-10382(-)
MSAPRTRPEANISDEPSSSTLFLPFPSFYVRQLREASHPLPPDDDEDDIGSEPSDDGAERRYSDVSIHSDHLPVNYSLTHRSSVKRSSYTLCSRTKSYPYPRLNVNTASDASPPTRHPQPLNRAQPPALHALSSSKQLPTNSATPLKSTAAFTFTVPKNNHHAPLSRRSSTPAHLRFTSTQPSMQTQSCLPAAYQPSLSPQLSTPSNSHSPTTLELPPMSKPTSPTLRYVQSIDVETPYTFCTPPTSTSLPSFELHPTQPHPSKIRSHTPRPSPAEQPRSKRASFWRLISGKRSSRREKKPKQEQTPAPEQPPRKAKPWKCDSLKLMRRTSLRSVSAYPATLANHAVAEETKSNTSNFLYQRRRQRRGRPSNRASFSGFSGENMENRTRGESLSFSRLAQPPRTRFAYYAEDKREASSFAGYRARILVPAEGSSVSSSSDRDEDAFFCVPDSNIYLTKRQLRALQYK